MVILFKLKKNLIIEEDEVALRTQIEKLIPKLEHLKETMSQLTMLLGKEVSVRIWLRGSPESDDYLLEANQHSLAPYQIFLKLKSPFDHDCKYGDVWGKG